MQEMKNSSLRFGQDKAKFVDMVIYSSTAGIADTCSFDQARGRGAGAGRSLLLVSSIGLA